MEEQALKYSFVARGTTVVAEYTEFAGNFPAIAAQYLQRLPASGNEYVYNSDQHSFNFLLHDGYVYGVVAKESVSKKVCISFLERFKKDFIETYGDGKDDTTMAKSLTKDLGPVMKEHMLYVIEHAEEIIKVSKSEFNLEELIRARPDAFCILTSFGEPQPMYYRSWKWRRQIKRWRQYYQEMKVNLMMIGILLMLAVIIWISVCHGFNQGRN